jgi:hypothetical protein
MKNFKAKLENHLYFIIYKESTALMFIEVFKLRVLFQSNVLHNYREALFSSSLLMRT